MRVVAETEVKKDARNRVTLPGADYDHYYVMAFDDGHFELYPRVLTDPLISTRTLGMIDSSMANLRAGKVGSAAPSPKPGITRKATRRKKGK